MENTHLISMFIAAALLLLAFLMGFVASRTTLCTVRAVDEILFRRRATLLFSFVQVMLWVVAISMVFEWLFGRSASTPAHFALQPQSLVGGLIFGIGAALNGGCSLHTLIRLGSGDFAMAISIAGLTCGALLCKLLYWSSNVIDPVGIVATFSLEQVLAPESQQIVVLICGLWMLLMLGFALLSLFRASRGLTLAQCKTRVLVGKYSLSTAALLLGLGNGLLFVLAGTWMYTHTLVQGLTNWVFADSTLSQPLSPLLWWLMLALLAGIIFSAKLNHSFHWVIKPELKWLSYFLAGNLMGFGATLIPGGNDTLILNAIPGLSPHALPAYLSMLVGVSIVLLIRKTAHSSFAS
ncbi:MAG: putative membrane protein YedE/YeeE [Phenylobacterium sp.]|jgi:uncharacterized membrane protein YedE/YeeE